MEKSIKICGIRTMPKECKIVYLVESNFEESYEILKKSHSFEHYNDNESEYPTVLNFLLEDGTESIHYLKDAVDFDFLYFGAKSSIHIGLIDSGDIIEERFITENEKYLRRKH